MEDDGVDEELPVAHLRIRNIYRHEGEPIGEEAEVEIETFAAYSETLGWCLTDGSAYVEKVRSNHFSFSSAFCALIIDFIWFTCVLPGEHRGRGHRRLVGRVL